MLKCDQTIQAASTCLAVREPKTQESLWFWFYLRLEPFPMYCRWDGLSYVWISNGKCCPELQLGFYCSTPSLPHDGDRRSWLRGEQPSWHFNSRLILVLSDSQQRQFYIYQTTHINILHNILISLCFVLISSSICTLFMRIGYPVKNIKQT